MRQTGFHSSDDFQELNSYNVAVAAAIPGAGELAGWRCQTPAACPGPAGVTAPVSPASHLYLFPPHC